MEKVGDGGMVMGGGIYYMVAEVVEAVLLMKIKYVRDIRELKEMD